MPPKPVTPAAGSSTAQPTATTATGSSHVTTATPKIDPKKPAGQQFDPTGSLHATPTTSGQQYKPLVRGDPNAPSPGLPPVPPARSGAPVDTAPSRMTGMPQSLPVQAPTGPSSSVTAPNRDPLPQALHEQAQREQAKADLNPQLGAKPVTDGMDTAQQAGGAIAGVSGPDPATGFSATAVEGNKAIGLTKMNNEMTRQLDPAAAPQTGLRGVVQTGKEMGQALATDAKQAPGQLLNKAQELIPGQTPNPERDHAQATAKQQLAQQQLAARKATNVAHPETSSAPGPEAAERAEQERKRAAAAELMGHQAEHPGLPSQQ